MATKTVTFESKYGAFNLVRQRKVQIPLPTGGYHTTQKTVDYQFQPVPSPKAESGFVGVLTVKAGKDKLSTDDEAFLADGEEIGVERDAVAALMASRAFNDDFWVQGHAPGTVYPRPAEWRRDVTLATANLADDKMIEMIAEERRTHGRIDLLAEAEEALEVVTEIIAAEQAKRAEAEAAKPAAKAKPKAPAAA